MKSHRHEAHDEPHHESHTHAGPPDALPDAKRLAGSLPSAAVPLAGRIAYFDCFAGISGDMTLGALIAAGVDEGELCRGLESLGLPGWELRTRRVQRHAITATDVEVIEEHEHKHAHASPDHVHEAIHDRVHGRHLAEILTMIGESALPPPVKERASAAFQRLGEAEAKIHNVPVETIHFHEVGAVDSIIDIVGSVLGVHLLGIQRIVCSPLPTGHGFVRAAHGLMPIPAPATMELLKGVPMRAVDVEGELVTPTGATLMVTLADEFGWMPAMRVEAIGYGAGKKEFLFPNLLRVCIGTPVE